MNLVIAVEQLAAIIDVWCAHRATAREGDCSRRAKASANITAAGVRCVAAKSTVLEVNSVASRDAIPEVDQILIGTCAIQFGQFRVGQHPDADAIAIRYPIVLFA